jgi:hypothetical protein
MWTFIPRRHLWSLSVANPPSAPSVSDAQKQAYELRILTWLLPTFLEDAPPPVIRRESPDFEISTTGRAVFVEIVDAVPDAVSSDGSTMNLAERRSRDNPSSYHVERGQFGATIARVIEEKRRKARAWISKEPELQGKLSLFVNGGQGPLWLRHYFPDADALRSQVAMAATDPFTAIVLGDETGAFIAGSLPLQRASSCSSGKMTP